MELIDGTNVKYFSSRDIEWDNNNMRVQSILNNYALGINDRMQLYRNIRTEGLEKTMLIYQIFKFVTTENEPPKSKHVRPGKQPEILKTQGNGDYIQLDTLNESPDDDKPLNTDQEVPLTELYLRRALEEAELNDSGLSPYPVYHFDRHFAAGMIASSSFMPTLLCQSYFRPYIIDIVKGLIANVCAIPVIESLIGKTYVQVVTASIARGYIPLGLYRNGSLKYFKDNGPMPYVYTNPRHGDIVNKSDLIFAVRRA